MIIIKTLVAAVAAANSLSSDPFLSQFDFGIDKFTLGRGYQYYWSIKDPDTPNETLHGALVFNGTQHSSVSPNTNITGMWFGLGFGKSMLTAEFLIAHCTRGSSTPNVMESVSTGGYEPPVNSPFSKVFILDNMKQTCDLDRNIAIVEFKRVTNVNDNLHRVLEMEQVAQLWAFNTDPNPAGKNGWMFSHGINRGRTFINYNTATVDYSVPDGLFAKQVHALSMSIIWMFLFPMSLFVTRYFRFLTGWITMHMSIQSIGSYVGMAASAIYMILTLPDNGVSNSAYGTVLRPHSIVGLTVVAFTYVQGFLGMAHRRSMIVENKLIESKKIAWITGGHRWLGRVLVGVAFIQAALGLQVLYPWEELKFRGVGYWITYFINAIFWLLLFVLAELYRKYRFELPGIKYKKIGNKLQKIENKRDPVLSVISDKPKFYTWKDIAEEMEKDNLLVVAEGKYVIQINSWLNNHPGGSIILRSVAGTDITPDYFNESGFDIEGFIPRTIEQLPRKKTFTPTKEGQQEKRISIDKKPKYTPEQEQVPLSISKSEWDAVLKARRTHVHSRLAIKKLSLMIVGELTTNTTETRFDKYENRRYAIVSKTLENSSQSNPIYRIKFALLYPFERRTHQPQILPGQSVLIRYFYNRQYHQCHYTPVTNDLNAFEICVKSYPEGNVSRFLTEQEPGNRQFQISGPFGDPIFNPYYSIKDTAGETSTLISGYSGFQTRFSNLANFDSILCITGGSGFTVSLALIQSLFLQTNVPLQAWQGYIPAQRDELFISRGDYVVVFSHIIGEGWAYGLNMNTNNKGMFPLSITFPPTPTKLAVLNTCKTQKDIFGKGIVSHALLSYPIEFSILHLLTKEDLEQSETFGNCIGGRIDENIIEKMLNDLWDYTRSKSQIVLIIGPNEMQGNVTDLLLSNGLEQTDLKIFGNSQRLIAKKKIDGIGLIKEAINSVS